MMAAMLLALLVLLALVLLLLGLLAIVRAWARLLQGMRGVSA